MGSARSLPDSRWRLFFDWDCSSTVWSKSHRRVLPDLLNVRYHCPRYLLNSSLDRRLRVILLCQFVHLDALLLGPANFWVAIHDRLGLFGNDREFLCNVLLERQLFCSLLFHALKPTWYSFCASVLPCRAPWWRSFLDHLVRDREHPVLIC